jgi:hypothetical protein
MKKDLHTIFMNENNTTCAYVVASTLQLTHSAAKDMKVPQTLGFNVTSQLKA